MLQLCQEVIVMNDTQLQILATIIVGVFSIVSVLIQTNKSSKNKYITGERSEWRKKLKELCSELLDDKNNQKRVPESILADFRTRLNAYGYIERSNIYKDGHIWDLLDKIEAEPENYSLKKKLVIYITFLMKHDWERSKSEVSIKIPKLISSCMYILSNALFIYFAFSETVDMAIQQKYINDLIVIISIFSFVYFFPNILKFIYGFSEGKHEFEALICIYLLTGSFYIVYFFDKETFQFGILNFPILLQAISVVINGISDVYDCKQQMQYEKTLNKQVLDFEENNNDSEKYSSAIESNNKNMIYKLSLKKYSIKEVLLSPLILIWSIFKLLWQFLLFLIQLFVNIFYGLIKALDSAIEYLKNNFNK